MWEIKTQYVTVVLMDCWTVVDCFQHFTPAQPCTCVSMSLQSAAFTSYQIYPKYKQPSQSNYSYKCNFQYLVLPQWLVPPEVGLLVYQRICYDQKNVWPIIDSTTVQQCQDLNPPRLQCFRFLWYDVNMALSFSFDETVY